MNLHDLHTSAVNFDAKSHTYHLDGVELQGITGTLVSWVFPSTYDGIPQAVLDKAAEHGSYVHSCIEMADVVGATPDCPESADYLRIMDENNCKSIAHEYTVSDEQHFASQIDLVLEQEGKCVLGDIKCTSKLHIPNVTLQLNIYRYLFELNNPTIKVEKLAAVWLPKQQYGKSAWVDLQLYDKNLIESLIADYLAGKSGERWAALFGEETTPTTSETLPAQYDDIVVAIAELEQRAKDIKAQADDMKKTLLQAFRDHNVKKVENDLMTITYVAPTKRTSVDSKKLQSEHPDIYNDCLRESNVSDSIKITLKKKAS